MRPFPWWKRIVWRLFGTRHVGYDFSFDLDQSVIIVAYHFRGVTYIAKEIRP